MGAKQNKKLPVLIVIILIVLVLAISRRMAQRP